MIFIDRISWLSHGGEGLQLGGQGIVPLFLFSPMVMTSGPWRKEWDCGYKWPKFLRRVAVVSLRERARSWEEKAWNRDLCLWVWKHLGISQYMLSYATREMNVCGPLLQLLSRAVWTTTSAFQWCTSILSFFCVVWLKRSSEMNLSLLKDPAFVFIWLLNLSYFENNKRLSWCYCGSPWLFRTLQYFSYYWVTQHSHALAFVASLLSHFSLFDFFFFSSFILIFENLEVRN